MTPEDLQFTAEHEWVRVDGSVATVGITDFAQKALGDIVYVVLPAVGDALTPGGACGEVESTKSVSEIYAPLAGAVVERNEALDGAPETVNADPYGDGWLFRVEMADAGQLAGLLSAAQYAALTQTA